MNRINWVVLTLIGLTCLYFFLSQHISSESDKEFSLDYKNNNGAGSSSGLPVQNNKLDKKISEIIPKYKTEPKLWRSFDSSSNSSVDKVADLMTWIEDFSQSENLRNSRPKRILVFDGFESYYGTEGKLKCGFNDTSLLKEKCIVKEDKLLGVTNYAGYDAFVGVRNWKNVIYDRKITSVRHVFFIEESPFVVKYADLSMNNAILASYWRGSDIVLPYGYFSKYKTPIPLPSRNYATGKTKFAAIIVSNCEAKNDRLRYVQELNKYISVHIYGACGPYQCNDNCFETVKKEYKFYLSFEKANCKDYITEKFWTNALKYDAVPVVLGAHPDDYKALAPPDSYIHVEDFKSPKELANYLIKLDKNDTLYNKYFSWKEKGQVTSVWQEFFCRLCGILFYAEFYQESPTWPLGSSWGNVNHCLPVNKWYWTRSDS